MKINVLLPDAFRSVEVEITGPLLAWFEREALSKGVTLGELLSAKTRGLTVAQLAAAASHGPIEEYVLSWIAAQDHTIGSVNTPIVPALNEEQVAALAKKA